MIAVIPETQHYYAIHELGHVYLDMFTTQDKEHGTEDLGHKYIIPPLNGETSVCR